MIIKSNISRSKKMNFHKLEIFSLLIESIIIAFFLAIIITGSEANLFVKFIFLLFGFFIIDHDISKNDDIEQDKEKIKLINIIKNCLYIILTFIFLEIFLFLYAKSYYKIKVVSVVPSTVTITKKSSPENKNIIKKAINIYDLETNEKIETKIIDSEEEKKLYENIQAIEYYVDYIPFLKFSKEFRYVKENEK